MLNGSGVPGVGELVAERIVPGGFRVVVSENAATFDHDETLVVVGSADDVGLGERVRDLLGYGSVNVSVSSGIAPVTIVVGKDFTGLTQRRRTACRVGPTEPSESREAAVAAARAAAAKQAAGRRDPGRARA